MIEEQKATFVVADDEAHVRLYVKSLLRTLDFELVGEAANGTEAIAEYTEKKPDLLLLDVNMPICDGEEALTRIMNDFPDAKVIMLSSVADRDSVERCIQLGATHYIRKDCAPEEVRQIVRQALEQ